MKIVNKQSAPRYKRDGITSYLLVSELTTNAKNITTTLVEMIPGGSQHIHQHETEQSYFIISGEGKMTVSDTTNTVKEGDAIFIPSNTPHGLINTGDSVLHYFSAGSPPFGKEKEIHYWPETPERN